MSIHLIRFRDRATRVRAIAACRKVPFARVALPGDIWGVMDEHLSALKKARVPFLFVSKEPTRKGKHGPAVQS